VALAFFSADRGTLFSSSSTRTGGTRRSLASDVTGPPRSPRPSLTRPQKAGPSRHSRRSDLRLRFSTSSFQAPCEGDSPHASYPSQMCRFLFYPFSSFDARVIGRLSRHLSINFSVSALFLSFFFFLPSLACSHDGTLRSPFILNISNTICSFS